jgi:hypothetical protein
MASRRLTTGACVVMLAALFAACDDDNPGSGDTGGNNEAGAGSGTIVSLKPCLERPGELQRPPSGGLPCDLLPPDFGR